jgi:hypothetical protein
MNDKEFTALYRMHQRKIADLDENITRWEKLRDGEEAKLAALAIGSSADLTELREGQTIESDGKLYLVQGDIMADVDEKSHEIVITLFALRLENCEPETLHLAAHPGKNWNYPRATTSDGKEAA